MQKQFVEAVIDRGISAHVFDSNKNCVCAPIADTFHLISIDDKEKILALAEELSPVGIHTVATESGNLTACYIGEKLGLCTNSYLTAQRTTNKALMKAHLDHCGIQTPQFITLDNIESINTNSITFPIMVKAVDSSAGRGIRLAHNETELIEAFIDAMDQSIQKIVLLENFAVGEQYSIETITHRGQHEIIAITEQWLDGSDHCVETGHILPAPVEPCVEHAIISFCQDAMDAMNIRFGACHIEVKHREGEITLIEMASRMGGWRDWMIKYGVQVNYVDAILDSTLDVNPEVCPTHSDRLSTCRIITSQSDFELYNKLVDLRPNSIIVDIVKDCSSITRPYTLYDTYGLYIYESSLKFEQHVSENLIPEIQSRLLIEE